MKQLNPPINPEEAKNLLTLYSQTNQYILDVAKIYLEAKDPKIYARGTSTYGDKWELKSIEFNTVNDYDENYNEIEYVDSIDVELVYEAYFRNEWDGENVTLKLQHTDFLLNEIDLKSKAIEDARKEAQLEKAKEEKRREIEDARRAKEFEERERKDFERLQKKYGAK